MEIAIAVAAAVVIIGIISALFLFRPNKSRKYSRLADEDNYNVDADRVERPRERPVPRERPPKIQSINGGPATMALLLGGFRALIGLAAVVVLVFIFNSTRETLRAYTDVDTGSLQVIRVYAEGIFQAVITIGITVALYIFSRFTHH